jgi:uncharacterized membrane protein
LAGLSLVGIGLSHFVKPELYESVTVSAFPRNTRQFVYINGGIETAIGLGLAGRKTRKPAALGTLGYLAYLGANAARNR